MAEHMRALMLKVGDRVVLRGKPGTVNQVVHSGPRVRLTVQVDGASAISTTLTGETLVETLNYQPRRGDAVERWLEDWGDYLGNDPAAGTVAAMLREYRRAADSGQSLSAVTEVEFIDA